LLLAFFDDGRQETFRIFWDWFWSLPWRAQWHLFRDLPLLSSCQPSTSRELTRNDARDDILVIFSKKFEMATGNEATTIDKEATEANMNNNSNIHRYVYGSLTRASDLKETEPSWSSRPLRRKEWETGDFVVGKFDPTTSRGGGLTETVEISTGRHARLMKGDLLVGALGVRRATLESVGDWKSIGEDGRMEDLTRAGLFGRELDHSIHMAPHPSFLYQGHVIRQNGSKVTMRDFAAQENLPESESTCRCPTTILVIGTSMSVGKTCTARVIIRTLKDIGVNRVVGTKLTGAGCYSDILSFSDAGADAVFDFVDAGLPSSVVPPEDYHRALKLLLAKVSASNPDVVVAEAGASPFEAYNGATAMREMTKRADLIVLCASDPYAVLGVMKTYGIQPDLISGIATTTSAGIELVQTMTGIPALSLQTEESINELRKLLTVLVDEKKIADKRSILQQVHCRNSKRVRSAIYQN